jgi:hypothetical protein
MVQTQNVAAKKAKAIRFHVSFQELNGNALEKQRLVAPGLKDKLTERHVPQRDGCIESHPPSQSACV